MSDRVHSVKREGGFYNFLFFLLNISVSKYTVVVFRIGMNMYNILHKNIYNVVTRTSKC